jgi:hypothetical protein
MRANSRGNGDHVGAAGLDAGHNLARSLAGGGIDIADQHRPGREIQHEPGQSHRASATAVAASAERMRTVASRDRTAAAIRAAPVAIRLAYGRRPGDELRL